MPSLIAIIMELTVRKWSGQLGEVMAATVLHPELKLFHCPGRAALS